MKVLTLNAHAWREENSDEKIIYLAAIIIEKDYDIIALQEVNQMTDAPLIDNSHLRSNNYMVVLLEEIERQGGPKYYSYWQSSKILRDYYEEGSCILSKTPIIEEMVFTVSQNAKHTSPKKRNIVRITTIHNGKLMDIYSCHLGWWYDEIEPFKPQWEAIYGHLRNDRLSLLLGDFNNNANIRGEGYDFLMEHGLWDTYALAKEKDNGATVQGEIAGWQGNQLDLRIDLILTSKKVEVMYSKVIFNGVHKEIISDHYGVEVEMIL
ncbi:MAG: endonuclease [Cellulosilyticum sp.]|nr:endonuclease [Cellulosilyticum sp.]